MSFMTKKVTNFNVNKLCSVLFWTPAGADEPEDVVKMMSEEG